MWMQCNAMQCSAVAMSRENPDCCVGEKLVLSDGRLALVVYLEHLQFVCGLGIPRAWTARKRI